MKVDDTGVIEKFHRLLLNLPQKFVHNKKSRLRGLPFLLSVGDECFLFSAHSDKEVRVAAPD